MINNLKSVSFRDNRANKYWFMLARRHILYLSDVSQKSAPTHVVVICLRHLTYRPIAFNGHEILLLVVIYIVCHYWSVSVEKSQGRKKENINQKIREVFYSPVLIFRVPLWRRVCFLRSHISDSETSDLATEVGKLLSKSSAGVLITDLSRYV
jgi:hypothetical protein